MIQISGKYTYAMIQILGKYTYAMIHFIIFAAEK